jgi:hypothetical protein
MSGLALRLPGRLLLGVRRRDAMPTSLVVVVEVDGGEDSWKIASPGGEDPRRKDAWLMPSVAKGRSKLSIRIRMAALESLREQRRLVVRVPFWCKTRKAV